MRVEVVPLVHVVLTPFSPGVIKFNGVYHFYGRLNTNLDERLVFLIKSKDLINWTKPVRLNIQNNECKMRLQIIITYVYFRKEILYLVLFLILKRVELFEKSNKWENNPL